MTKLPSGWRQVHIEDIAETALGKMLDKGKPRGYPHVPYLRNVNVQWGRIDTSDLLTMELADNDRERFGVRKGDLLICEGGEPGRAAIWDRDGDYIAYQKALHRVRPRGNEADARFLMYAFLHAARTGALEPFTTGSTIAHLPQQNLRQLPLALPSMAEQRRVTEILEDHLSRLDAASACISAAIARSKRLITGALWQTTHNLPGTALTRLDDVAEVRLGRQRSPRNHLGDRMRPYLRAANVDWDVLRLDDVKEMNFTEAEERIYQLRSGDVLLTEASGSPAEVGKSALYEGDPQEVCFQNTLLRVRCRAANPRFVQKYLLAEAMMGRFMPEARGVGINHLGRAKLASLQIALPGASSQAAVAAQCSELIAGVQRLRVSLERQEHRSRSLRRALLDAVFSGRLTGASSDMDWTEELTSV